MSIPSEILEAEKAERRRIIGVILEQVGIWRLKGDEKTANVLDQLALRIEHPNAELFAECADVESLRRRLRLHENPQPEQ